MASVEVGREHEIETAVHAVNASKFRRGALFGWRDEQSPTGWLSGYVVRTGNCVVYVRSVAPGIMMPSLRR